jgi:hypothetical protein
LLDEKGHKIGQNNEVDKQVVDTGRSGGNKVGRATKNRIAFKDRE